MSNQEVILQISGMTCGNCVAHVERALSSVPGVVKAHVNLGTQEATVTLAPGAADVADLTQAVVGTGRYRAMEAAASA